jgi:hypothetical protein
LFFGEPAKGLVNRFVDVPARHRGFVRLYRPGPAFTRLSKRAVALELPDLTLPPPQPVYGPVSRDAEDPGHQPAFRSVVQIHPAPHDVEGFLNDFLGFVTIAEHAVGNAEQPRGSEINQLYECLFVSRQQPIV